MAKITLPQETTRPLVDIGRSFYERGWVLGTSGNFSVVVGRDPLRLAITPSGAHKGEMTAEQIVEIGADGKRIGEHKERPSAESLPHVAVVRATGAGAVVHTHSIWSTIMSELHAADGGFFVEGYEMLKGLEGITTHDHREWIPILENSQEMEKLSAEIEAVLKKNPHAHAFLLRKHGLYTWGKDLVQVKRHVEIVEFLLEAQGRSERGR